MAYLNSIETFLPQTPFTKELIREYYLKNGEAVTEQNLNVRLNRLKTKGIIVNIGRGWYKLNNRKNFEPEIYPAVKKVSGKLKKDFPFLHYLIWSTAWLNAFATLQLFRCVQVVEVEAGSEEAVFNRLKEAFPYKTFLNPSEADWIHYMADQEECVVVKTQVSESPKYTTHAIKLAKLEKILVDLYCDKFWLALFASEMHNIYTEACSGYSLNFTALLRYAGRRGKRQEIWEYIKTLNVLDQDTIDIMEK